MAFFSTASFPTVVDHYQIWCNLKPGVKDLEFVAAVDAMLGHLKGKGLLEGHQLMRRKFGFGPANLGEFFLDIQTKDLAQLDAAFNHVTPRTGEMERLHAMVWSKVTDFQAGLCRDFPDKNRVS